MCQLAGNGRQQTQAFRLISHPNRNISPKGESAMQSVVTFEPRETSKNIESYRREKSFYQQWTLIDLDKGVDVITVRFYGPGSTVYCVAWVSLWRHGFPAAGSTGSCRGHGKAGGYGYHKASAAMSEALADAGFTLAESISGVGESAMRKALEAIARHAGIARPYIHQAHA